MFDWSALVIHGKTLFFSFWNNGHWPKELVVSVLILFGIALVQRLHFNRLKQQAHLSFEQKRASHIQFRNGSIVILFVLLGFVWGGELRSLVLSLAALGAAILIVSKELISCLYGSLLFTLYKPAKVGEAIELAGYKGELADQHWFYLTLMELSESEEYTGRLIKVPTSFLVTHSIFNRSHDQRYTVCLLEVEVSLDRALQSLSLLEQEARKVVSQWQTEAQEYFNQLREQHLAHTPNTDIKAQVLKIHKDSALLQLRFISPKTSKAQAISQILDAFLKTNPQDPSFIPTPYRFRKKSTP